MVSLWAILAVFHEISNSPEYANESMLRRLFRIRENTESFFHNLSNKLDKNRTFPKNYLFFKGKVFETSLSSFMGKNDFILKNE